MREQQIAALMALSFVPKLGPKKLSTLLTIDSPENLVLKSTSSLQALGLTEPQISFLRKQSIKEVDICLEWQQQDDCHIISILDDHYPPLLKEISAAPPLLFVQGKTDLLLDPQIAIVGSRNASPEALELARSLSGELAKNGLVVTSGLALGVDGYAHDGALNHQGETIAVLGSGLNKIYPARHRGLAERVIGSGALVSEFRPNTPARPDNFPRRNRIISGLSAGVLVIEAAEKSGSLITARYAIEQNRGVFALPWSILHSHGQGGNTLIKSGATLVTSAKEVIAEIDSLINWSLSQRVKPQQPSLFSEEVSPKTDEPLPFPELFDNVGFEATPVDILAQRTNIPVHEVMMQLLELELSGHVTGVAGGYIRKRRGEL